MSEDDRALVNRAAHQLFGLQSPFSHLQVVLRGLGLSPVQAAPLLDAILARLAELEAGTYDAAEAYAMARRDFSPSLEGAA